jgi:hypothetical protein
MTSGIFRAVVGLICIVALVGLLNGQTQDDCEPTPTPTPGPTPEPTEEPTPTPDPCDEDPTGPGCHPCEDDPLSEACYCEFHPDECQEKECDVKYQFTCVSYCEKPCEPAPMTCSPGTFCSEAAVCIVENDTTLSECGACPDGYIPYTWSKFGYGWPACDSCS